MPRELIVTVTVPRLTFRMGILPCDVFALPQLAKLNETALNNSDPEKMKQEMTKRHASFHNPKR